MLSETAIVNQLIPVVGGVVVLIWLVYRLFFLVDRRSQQDAAVKDSEIRELKKVVEKERQLRYDAEDRASRAESRETTLEQRVTDLTASLAEVREEVRLLRENVKLLKSVVQ